MKYGVGVVIIFVFVVITPSRAVWTDCLYLPWITAAITTQKRTAAAATVRQQRQCQVAAIVAMQTVNCFCMACFFSSANQLYNTHTRAQQHIRIQCNHIYPSRNGFRVRFYFHRIYSLSLSLLFSLHSQQILDWWAFLCIAYIPKRTEQESNIESGSDSECMEWKKKCHDKFEIV